MLVTDEDCDYSHEARVFSAQVLTLAPLSFADVIVLDVRD